MTPEETPIEIAPEHASALGEMGVEAPAPGRPLRVLFIGQRTYFDSSALNHATPEIEPQFVDFRAGADSAPVKAALERFDPQVVIVFRPEIIPPRLLHGTRALSVGILTEPLPRPTAGREHPDLKRRLSYLKGLDGSNFDRIISFDPLMVESASAHATVWRSMPLAVADEFFQPVERWSSPPRPVFMGRSTRHREAWLIDAKHHLDILHIAHGVFGDELRELLARPSISFNIHNEPYPTFEVRVPLCLASGNLVVSEALSPSHGLEADIDFLEVMSPANLVQIVEQVNADPGVYHQVRAMGRMKAERFRASRVYPRMISDVCADVAVFGRGDERRVQV